MTINDLRTQPGHRVPLAVQRAPVLFLVLTQEVRRPLAERRDIPERRGHAKLNDVTRLRAKLRYDVGVRVGVELNAVPSVEDGEVTGTQIDFDHGRAIDCHLKTL